MGYGARSDFQINVSNCFFRYLTWPGKMYKVLFWMWEVFLGTYLSLFLEAGPSFWSSFSFTTLSPTPQSPSEKFIILEPFCLLLTSINICLLACTISCFSTNSQIIVWTTFWRSRRISNKQWVTSASLCFPKWCFEFGYQCFVLSVLWEISSPGADSIPLQLYFWQNKAPMISRIPGSFFSEAFMSSTSTSGRSKIFSEYGSGDVGAEWPEDGF